MGILKSSIAASCKPSNMEWINLDSTSIIGAARLAGLMEYGTYHTQAIAEKWENAHNRSQKPSRVIVALNNNDTSHMLLEILKQNTEAVIDGLLIAAKATGAENMEITIPSVDEELCEKINAIAKQKGIDIRVTTGMVDVIAAKNDVVHHIETAAAIAGLFQDISAYEKTTVVAVKKAGAKIGEPMEINYGVKIADIIDRLGISKDEIKAAGIGTRLYDTSIFDMQLDQQLRLDDGVITLFDTKSCMADQLEKTMLQVRKESCGKCTFCREGSIQLHTMAKDITSGKGKPSDPAIMQEIGTAMKFSSLCSMGQTGADFLLDAFNSFGVEIEEHIRKKRCSTEACTAFKNIYIDPSACSGCGDCIDVCEAACIEGKTGFIHMIDEFDCTKCGKCIGICPEGAVHSTTGRLPKLPERLTRVGRFNKR